MHRLADSRGNPDILRKIPSHGSLESNQKKHRTRKSTRQNKGEKKKKTQEEGSGQLMVF